MYLTRERISLGRAGEEYAAKYLQKRGFRIVERNFRCKLGELDIVARDGPFLVFTEVRSMTGKAFGSPQESITDKKKKKLRQVAQFYAKFRNVGDTPMRFDVVAITADSGGNVIKLDHIVNAL
ncbi:MAG: hypothetical protein VR68_01980 [Peptococcaceae bacterium BRH_c4a]|nr:MAG: hypothetical protein VR68_01980 [Peptococcaceae bacterium BRH_c4a]